MVFSPDGEDIMLGSPMPPVRHYDDEMIGGSSGSSLGEDIINENYESLDALLNLTRGHAPAPVEQKEPAEDLLNDDMSALDALFADEGDSEEDEY